MYGQLVAVFDRAHDLVDVAEVQLGIHALREQVQRQVHDVDIARALAIAEQRAFDAVRARQHAHFGGGDTRAAIVMRMQRQDIAVAMLHVAREPFDLVGVDVGRRGFDRRGQIEDHLLLRGRAPFVHHRLADFLGEIELGLGEAFGAVLEHDFRLRHRRHQTLDRFRALDRDLDDARPVEREHHAALHGRGRVVEMHDRALGALDRLERALDQLVARLGQHLDRHVGGDRLVVDQLAHEIEIGLRRGGETDFDFLEAQAHQQIEHAALALGPHRLDQRLVAVAQIDRAPHRRLVERAGRPLAVRQIDRRELAIFGDVFHRGHFGGSVEFKNKSRAKTVSARKSRERHCHGG